MYPNVTAVFVDTGLEYPVIIEFVQHELRYSHSVVKVECLYCGASTAVRHYNHDNVKKVIALWNQRVKN